MKYRSFTEGSIGKSIFFFSLPLLASSFIQQLYSTVDLIFVGHFTGTHAYAAIGASDLLITCLIGFFNGMAVGTNVISSHYYGSENYDKLKKLMRTVFIFGIAGGLLLMAIGICFAPLFLSWMDTPDEIHGLAVRYLRIYMMGIISIILYNLCSGILRAMGDSRSPMMFQLIGCAINIFADFLLIAVWNFGVTGAALATLFSQTVAMVLCVVHLHRLDSKISLNFFPLSCPQDVLIPVLKIGIPVGIQSIVITLSNIIIQWKINGFGVDVIAAFATYFKVEMVIYLPILALGQAIVSFIGQNYGALQFNRIKKGFRMCLIFGLILTVMTSVLLTLAGAFIFGLFTDDHHVIQYGCRIITVTFPFYFLYVILECYSSRLRGMGRAVAPMVITLTSFCGIRILLLFILLHFHDEVSAVAATYPISWAIAVILLWLYYRFTERPKGDRYIGIDN